MIKKFHDCKGHRVLSHHSEGRSWHRSLQKIINYFLGLGLRMVMIMVIMVMATTSAPGARGWTVRWSRCLTSPTKSSTPRQYQTWALLSLSSTQHCHYQYHLHRRLLIKAILFEKCFKKTLRHWKSAQEFRILSCIALHIDFIFPSQQKGQMGPAENVNVVVCRNLPGFSGILEPLA